MRSAWMSGLRMWLFACPTRHSPVVALNCHWLTEWNCGRAPVLVIGTHWLYPMPFQAKSAQRSPA